MNVDREARDSRPASCVIELSDFDPLTRLPTGAAFSSALAGQLAGGANGKRAALLVFDIDRFRHVNDSFGVATGDAVLRAIGQVLAAMIGRRTFLSRLSREAFAVFLPGNAAEHTARAFARRLARRFAEGFRVGDRDFHFTLSVGIAFHPTHGVDAATMIHSAQGARHRAKSLGGDRIL